MPLKTRQQEEISLNLTPMIDVVFLLIIFFMVATKFTELEQNIELELPQVASAGEVSAPAEPRTVVVFADGHLELEGASISRDELIAQLTAEPHRNVVLQGDASCPFQHIADTLAACQEAKVTEIGVTVELAQAMRNSATTKRR